MAAGWAVTLAFLLLPHWFKITAIVSLLRSSGLTWSWICIVRRHLNEVNQIAHRPKLQTIISIASAHPFAPRFYETVLPTEIIDLIVSLDIEIKRLVLQDPSAFQIRKVSM